MLTKIKFICTLATFLFAGLTALLATILGVRFLAAGPFERFEVLQGAMLPMVGGAWTLAWSAWLAAYALDRLAGDPEAMRGLATRLADATEKVADRTRKAASRGPSGSASTADRRRAAPLSALLLASGMFVGCSNGLPAREVYEGIDGTTLVIRSATEADYTEGGDTFATRYELQEDGLVRLEIPIFGTTQVSFFELTDLGLLGAEIDDEEDTLFNRANRGCPMLLNEIRRLQRIQRSKQVSTFRMSGRSSFDADFIVHSEQVPEAMPRNGVVWKLTGVPDEYYDVRALHEECSFGYHYSVHHPESRGTGGFTDFDSEEREAIAAPTPGQTAKNFFHAVLERDFERAADLSFTEEDMSRAEIVAYLAELAEEDGDLPEIMEIEIGSVDVYVEGAFDVILEIAFVDEEITDTGAFVRVVTVDGRYKIDIDYF